MLSEEAESSQYFPEWICANGCESNESGRRIHDGQAEHFVATGMGEIPRADADKDWYRACKEIDPDGVPDDTYFRHLQQLSGGIQHAGSELTPTSFWDGLKTQPCRTPDPMWSIGGCYGDPDPNSEVHYLGDYTYIDYAGTKWFDNAGNDPQLIRRRRLVLDAQRRTVRARHDSHRAVALPRPGPVHPLATPGRAGVIRPECPT